MPDDKQLPAILEPDNRSQLLRLIDEAGQSNLNPIQTAMKLGVSENEFQMLIFSDPEVARRYQISKIEEMVHHLDIIREIANNSDPENKQRFQAAKYIYEQLSGKKPHFNTFVAIKNVNGQQQSDLDNNIKLIESLPADTLEAIQND